MYTQFDRLGQLAHEHHHEMLADARRRQLRHRLDRPAPRTPHVARRLGAVIAKAGGAAARVPGALRPARLQRLGETPAAR